MNETTYTTWGPVRGTCGHAHQTIAAAEGCAAKDRRGVQRGHGSNAYSDRYVTALPLPTLTTTTPAHVGTYSEDGE